MNLLSRSIVVLALLSITCCKPKTDEHAMLASGPYTSVAGALELSLTRPIELDGKTRAEILDLRRYFVNQHRELLTRDYLPNPLVFDALVDGAPWYGEEGFFVYGKGAECSRGRSVEGRALLNPLWVSLGLSHIKKLCLHPRHPHYLSLRDFA